MFKAPGKYECSCIEKHSGRFLLHKVFEAIDAAEARNRAFLTCRNINKGNADIEVAVKKVYWSQAASTKLCIFNARL